jgi:hypothetical protein
MSGILTRVTASDLDAEMKAHDAEPFPESIEKGADYGEVDAVMVGADIYGWATRAGFLSAPERSELLRAAEALKRSIAVLPPDARPYYERLIRIARLTLDIS